MKERPILFTTKLVEDILTDKKKQTRRIAKDDHQIKPIGEDEDMNKLYGHKFYNIPQSGRWGFCFFGKTEQEIISQMLSFCPYGKKGDRLWVRENLCNGSDGSWFYQAQRHDEWEHVINVPKDWHSKNCGKGVIPSIHMPRWAARLFLEITDVRIERMQDGGDREFWGEDKWNSNPWVWVIEFKRVL